VTKGTSATRQHGHLTIHTSTRTTDEPASECPANNANKQATTAKTGQRTKDPAQITHTPRWPGVKPAERRPQQLFVSAWTGLNQVTKNMWLSTPSSKQTKRKRRKSRKKANKNGFYYFFLL